MPMVVSVSLAEAMSTLTQHDLNERRVRSANMIWGTVSAAVGVCPGYDDFLVWLDFQNEPAMAIKWTVEAVDDFEQNVMPYIRRHKGLHHKLDSEYDSSEVEWLFTACNRVRDEGYPKNSQDIFVGRQNWEDMPSYQPCRDAYHDVVTALGGFLARHDTTPDPGTVLN